MKREYLEKLIQKELVEIILKLQQESERLKQRIEELKQRLSRTLNNTKI